MKQKTQYKQTPIGLIPLDWEVKKFTEIFYIFPTASYSRADLTDSDETLYMHYGDIHTKYHFHIDVNSAQLPTVPDDKVKNYELVKEGDLIISDASEDYEGVGKAIEVVNLGENKMIAGLHTFHLREKTQVFARLFKGYVSLHEDVVKQYRKMATGTKVYSISKDSLLKIQIPLPPLPEQQKIAEILSTWDKAIQQTQSLIQKLEVRNKALAFSLLTGKTRVINKENIKYHKTTLGSKYPIDWEITTIKKLFKERKEKSNDQTKYPLFSLTIEKGLTEKTDRYERSFLLKDQESNEYKLIHPNDILFNPMNLRFGAIAKSNVDQIVSVSAYYNSIYKNDDNINLDYYTDLFKTGLFLNLYDRIAIGSLLEKKRVHLSNLLDLEIPKPSLAEQNTIANILNTANKELKQYQEKLKALNEQKKGLMQQLLTGKVRTI